MEAELTEIQKSVARIDERTLAILENQEKQVDALAAHEERDRQDFKDVTTRINTLERKQNWMLGIISSVTFAGTIIIAFIKGFFGG